MVCVVDALVRMSTSPRLGLGICRSSICIWKSGPAFTNTAALIVDGREEDDEDIDRWMERWQLLGREDGDKKVLFGSKEGLDRHGRGRVNR